MNNKKLNTELKDFFFDEFFKYKNQKIKGNEKNIKYYNSKKEAYDNMNMIQRMKLKWKKSEFSLTFGIPLRISFFSSVAVCLIVFVINLFLSHSSAISYQPIPLFSLFVFLFSLIVPIIVSFFDKELNFFNIFFCNAIKKEYISYIKKYSEQNKHLFEIEKILVDDFSSSNKFSLLEGSKIENLANYCDYSYLLGLKKDGIHQKLIHILSQHIEKEEQEKIIFDLDKVDNFIELYNFLSKVTNR